MSTTTLNVMQQSRHFSTAPSASTGVSSMSQRLKSVTTPRPQTSASNELRVNAQNTASKLSAKLRYWNAEQVHLERTMVEVQNELLAKEHQLHHCTESVKSMVVENSRVQSNTTKVKEKIMQMGEAMSKLEEGCLQSKDHADIVSQRLAQVQRMRSVAETALTQQITDLGQIITVGRRSIEKVDEEEKYDESHQHHEQLELTNEDVMATQRRMEDTKAEIKRMKSQLDALETEKNAKLNYLERSELPKLNGLNSSLTDIVERGKKVREKVKTCKEGAGKLLCQSEAHQKELTRLETERHSMITEHRNQVFTLREQVARLDALNAECNKKTDKLSGTQGDIRRSIETMSSKTQEIREETKSYTEELNVIRPQLSHTQEDLQQCTDQVEKHKAEQLSSINAITESLSVISSLQQNNNDLRSKKAQLREKNKCIEGLHKLQCEQEALQGQLSQQANLWKTTTCQHEEIKHNLEVEEKGARDSLSDITGQIRAAKTDVENLQKTVETHAGMLEEKITAGKELEDQVRQESEALELRCSELEKLSQRIVDAEAINASLEAARTVEQQKGLELTSKEEGGAVNQDGDSTTRSCSNDTPFLSEEELSECKKTAGIRVSDQLRAYKATAATLHNEKVTKAMSMRKQIQQGWGQRIASSKEEQEEASVNMEKELEEAKTQLAQALRQRRKVIAQEEEELALREAAKREEEQRKAIAQKEKEALALREAAAKREEQRRKEEEELALREAAERRKAIAAEKEEEELALREAAERVEQRRKAIAQKEEEEELEIRQAAERVEQQRKAVAAEEEEELRALREAAAERSEQRRRAISQQEEKEELDIREAAKEQEGLNHRKRGYHTEERQEGRGRQGGITHEAGEGNKSMARRRRRRKAENEDDEVQIRQSAQSSDRRGGDSYVELVTATGATPPPPPRKTAAVLQRDSPIDKEEKSNLFAIWQNDDRMSHASSKSGEEEVDVVKESKSNTGTPQQQQYHPESARGRRRGGGGGSAQRQELQHGNSSKSARRRSSSSSSAVAVTTTHDLHGDSPSVDKKDEYEYLVTAAAGSGKVISSPPVVIEQSETDANGNGDEGMPSSSLLPTSPMHQLLAPRRRRVNSKKHQNKKITTARVESAPATPDTTTITTSNTTTVVSSKNTAARSSSISRVNRRKGGKDGGGGNAGTTSGCIAGGTTPPAPQVPAGLLSSNSPHWNKNKKGPSSKEDSKSKKAAPTTLVAGQVSEDDEGHMSGGEPAIIPGDSRLRGESIPKSRSKKSRSRREEGVVTRLVETTTTTPTTTRKKKLQTGGGGGGEEEGTGYSYSARDSEPVPRTVVGGRNSQHGMHQQETTHRHYNRGSVLKTLKTTSAGAVTSRKCSSTTAATENKRATTTVRGRKKPAKKKAPKVQVADWFDEGDGFTF